MTSRIHEGATIAPAVPDAATEVLAMSMARQEALEVTDDRRATFRSCADEVERWTGQVLWPGATGHARAAEAVMTIGRRGLSFGGLGYGYSILGDYGHGVLLMPACPLRPNTSGVTVAVSSVMVWGVEAGAYVAPPGGYRLLPGGWVQVDAPGTYQVMAILTAPTEPPAWAVEGLRRYFAYRERLRPGDAAAGDLGGQPVPAGGLIRSGAAEVLRAGRLRVAV